MARFDLVLHVHVARADHMSTAPLELRPWSRGTMVDAGLHEVVVRRVVLDLRRHGRECVGKITRRCTSDRACSFE